MSNKRNKLKEKQKQKKEIKKVFKDLMLLVEIDHTVEKYGLSDWYEETELDWNDEMDIIRKRILDILGVVDKKW